MGHQYVLIVNRRRKLFNTFWTPVPWQTKYGKKLVFDAKENAEYKKISSIQFANGIGVHTKVNYSINFGD